jgi:hypothetical protein
MKISHLQWFKEGDEFLESIVMDNETPVYHFPPRIKQAGMRSEHPNSPRSRQFKGCHSAEKDMASVFWGAERVVHVKFVPRCTGVKAKVYGDTLGRLREHIRRKVPRRLSRRGAIIQRNNATPYNARRTYS